MAEVIKMPRLSDTMEEGVVAQWLKKVGDKVSEGDILAEIETDKATMEFESFYDGTLLHIAIDEGVAANVDSLLCIIGEEGEDISSLISAPRPNIAAEGQASSSEVSNWDHDTNILLDEEMVEVEEVVEVENIEESAIEEPHSEEIVTPELDEVLSDISIPDYQADSEIQENLIGVDIDDLFTDDSQSEWGETNE